MKRDSGARRLSRSVNVGMEPAQRVDQGRTTACSARESQAEADAALASVRATLANRLASRRARQALGFGVILATCLAAAAMTFVVVALLLSREAPPWWREFDPNDPQLVELAERVERAVVSSMHRARPINEPWTVAVTAQQANAWLNVKLPRWVQSRNANWPPEIGQVQTNFADGKISVGVRIGQTDDDQIVAATISPQLHNDGSLWLTQPTTNAGRLDLPSGWTISRLAAWLPPSITQREMTSMVLDALRQRGPALPNTWVDLEDGRRVRLIGLSIDNERLLLSCVTEFPEQATASARD